MNVLTFDTTWPPAVEHLIRACHSMIGEAIQSAEAAGAEYATAVILITEVNPGVAIVAACSRPSFLRGPCAQVIDPDTLTKLRFERPSPGEWDLVIITAKGSGWARLAATEIADGSFSSRGGNA